MTTKSLGRVLLVLAALSRVPMAALAEEIVHFTNGAEMTVLSHAVEPGKNTLRLELGGNSFIAFPMSMVDKIVNAGKDVYVSPNFHPSNQAIAGSPGTGSNGADTSIRGANPTVGLVRQPNTRGGAGVMLGEAADKLPAGSNGGPQIDQTVANSRRVFNPAFPASPGGGPQVIMPPSRPVAPVQLSMLPIRSPGNPVTPPHPAPPASSGAPDNPPPSDPPPEDPPDRP
jgi:hypothetical protein